MESPKGAKKVFSGLKHGSVPIFGREVAIDLGTANTVIYERGKGIVLDEPSIVVIDEDSGEVISVGRDAKQQAGRVPKQKTVHPLEDGVIADFDVCAKMLREFIQKINVSRLIRPRMVICVPTRITPVERRAVIKVAENAGAHRNVYVIEEPVAAAIGAGLPIEKPMGSMIVDIGGGTTEIAVLSTGGIVISKSIPVAGNALDQAIAQYIKKEWDFSCALDYVERIKTKWVSAWPLKTEHQFTIRGINLRTGYPAELSIDTVALREAIEEPMQRIVDAVAELLDTTPPELVADIMEHGIMLAGGGSLVHGLSQRLQHETGLMVKQAPDPLYTVVKGCGMSLDIYKKLPAGVFTALSE